MILQEYRNFDAASIQLESFEDPSTKIKNLHMRGIFLQSELKNQNGRMYPRNEIEKAVVSLNERIKINGPVGGELNHPEGLELNPERMCCAIKEMWMEGNNGMGKMVILPTQLGNTVKVLLEAGIKLGVSSRGSGSVDSYGKVYDYSIRTIDIVSDPSAPEAFPKTIYEKLMHAQDKVTTEILHLAEAVNHDPVAQKYLTKKVLNWFDTALKY